MSAPFSTADSFDERLNEQLIRCFNVQNTVIDNLNHFSHHITAQLQDLKVHVEILTDRVLTLQEQQSQSHHALPVSLPPLWHPFVLSPFNPPMPPSPEEYLSFYPQVQPDFVPEQHVKPPTVPFSTKTTIEEISPKNPFVFTPIFSNDTFNNVSNLLPTTSTTHDEVDDHHESYEPTKTFDPIVTLEPVEVITGEEEENILFCERAKLYRYETSSSEFKERGMGPMKILQHKKTGVYRILMRREQVLNICANHRLTSQMELKPHQNSDKAYVWSAMDFADGNGKHETLCIKFKTKEIADTFVQTFNRAKFNEKLPSVADISLNKDDVIFLDELQPNADQINRAKRLQLPLTFYLYENKEPCRGCRGCDDEYPLFPPMLIHPEYLLNMHDPVMAAAILQSLSNLPLGFFQNSSLPSLMSMLPMWYNDRGDQTPTYNITPPPPPQRTFRTIIKAKRSLPANRAPPPPPSSSSSLSPSTQTVPEDVSLGVEEARASQAHQKKSRNISSQQSEVFSLDTFATQMAQTIMDLAKKELYKQLIDESITETEDSNQQFPSVTRDKTSDRTSTSSSSSNQGFPFNHFDATLSSPSTAFQFCSPTSSDTFVFGWKGDKSSLTFSDLAQQVSDQTLFSTRTNGEGFLGQGSQVFDSSPDNSDDDDDDEKADESYEPSVTFQPIVKLAPVEVKTGEEDEEILFCERAKLYRFDSPSNEIKERGIGPMKILQHKETGWCRVLMRREQIFKVCANHRITSTMELKPHEEKENTLTWFAVDFADRVAKPEKLYVKFKTKKITDQFYEQFNRAKEINGNLENKPADAEH